MISTAMHYSYKVLEINSKKLRHIVRGQNGNPQIISFIEKLLTNNLQLHKKASDGLCVNLALISPRVMFLNRTNF